MANDVRSMDAAGNWISIVGPTGVTGPQGLDGLTGPTGPMPTGLSIAPGPTGPTGTNDDIWIDPEDGQIYIRDDVTGEWVPAESLTGISADIGQIAEVRPDGLYVPDEVWIGDVEPPAGWPGEIWVDGAVTPPPGSQTPIGLDDLIDADTSTVPPVAGQALVWSVTGPTGLWVPGDVAASSTGPTGPLVLGSVDEHTDVDTVTAPPTVDGVALVWDGLNWVPSTIILGGVPIPPGTIPPVTGDYLWTDASSVMAGYIRANEDDLSQATYLVLGHNNTPDDDDWIDQIKPGGEIVLHMDGADRFQGTVTGNPSQSGGHKIPVDPSSPSYNPANLSQPVVFTYTPPLASRVITDVSQIGELADVDVPAAYTGQVLVYDQTAGQWRAAGSMPPVPGRDDIQWTYNWLYGDALVAGNAQFNGETALEINPVDADGNDRVGDFLDFETDEYVVVTSATNEVTATTSHWEPGAPGKIVLTGIVSGDITGFTVGEQLTVSRVIPAMDLVLTLPEGREPAVWRPQVRIPSPPDPDAPVWGAGFPYQWGPATVAGQTEIDAAGTLLTFNSVDFAGGTPIAPGTAGWRTDVRLTSTGNEVVFTGNAPFVEGAGTWAVPGTVTSGDPTAFTGGEAITLVYTLESQTTDEDLYLTLVDGQSPPQWLPITDAPSGGVDSLDDLTDVDTVTAPPTARNALGWDGTTWVPQTGLPELPPAAGWTGPFTYTYGPGNISGQVDLQWITEGSISATDNVGGDRSVEVGALAVGSQMRVVGAATEVLFTFSDVSNEGDYSNFFGAPDSGDPALLVAAEPVQVYLLSAGGSDQILLLPAGATAPVWGEGPYLSLSGGTVNGDVNVGMIQIASYGEINVRDGGPGSTSIGVGTITLVQPGEPGVNLQSGPTAGGFGTLMIGGNRAVTGTPTAVGQTLVAAVDPSNPSGFVWTVGTTTTALEAEVAGLRADLTALLQRIADLG